MHLATNKMLKMSQEAEIFRLSAMAQPTQFRRPCQASNRKLGHDPMWQKSLRRSRLQAIHKNSVSLYLASHSFCCVTVTKLNCPPNSEVLVKQAIEN